MEYYKLMNLLSNLFPIKVHLAASIHFYSAFEVDDILEFT